MANDSILIFRKDPLFLLFELFISVYKKIKLKNLYRIKDDDTSKLEYYYSLFLEYNTPGYFYNIRSHPIVNLVRPSNISLENINNSIFDFILEVELKSTDIEFIKSLSRDEFIKIINDIFKEYDLEFLDEKFNHEDFEYDKIKLYFRDTK